MKNKKVVISISVIAGIFAVAYLSLDGFVETSPSQSPSVVSSKPVSSLSRKAELTEDGEPKLQGGNRPSPEELREKAWVVRPIEPGHSQDKHFANSAAREHGHEVDQNERNHPSAPRGEDSPPDN